MNNVAMLLTFGVAKEPSRELIALCEDLHRKGQMTRATLEEVKKPYIPRSAMQDEVNKILIYGKGWRAVG
jgi:hypothetical protein